MTTEITTKFSLDPTTFQEAMEYSKLISSSSLCPKQFAGKPADVMLAIQMGYEIGLKPMQSLQNISVINGRPSVWGDAAIALCMAHPNFEDIQEYMDDDTAICIIKRKGMEPHTVKFGIEDAKKAKLWGKPGPWSDYTQRMMQMRARGFALRDRFSDALKGLILTEEAQDYPVEKEIKPVSVQAHIVDEEPFYEGMNGAQMKVFLLAIENSKTKSDLDALCQKIKDNKPSDEQRTILIDAYRAKKISLENKEVLEDLDDPLSNGES